VQLDRAQAANLIYCRPILITAAIMPIVSPSLSEPRHQLAIKVKTTLS
jgi:hypothetical protein